MAKSQKPKRKSARQPRKMSRATPAVKGIPTLPGGNTNSGTDKDKKLVAAANSKEALFGRISYGAGPSLTRYSSYPANALDPAKINSILREADLGWPLRYCEMWEQILERDGHLHGIDYSRRREVSGKSPRIHAKNETELAGSLAKMMRAIVDEIQAFDQACEDLLAANGVGYSGCENVYEFNAVRFTTQDGSQTHVDLLVPTKLEWVHPKHFRFDQVTDEPHLVEGTGEISLPFGKFTFHSATGTGLVERRGFMRACTWLHAAKNWSLRDWLVYANLFGIPQIDGVFDSDVSLSDRERATYEAALADYGKGIPVLHPSNFKINTQPPPAGGRANDVHGAIIGWANSEMSKCVLGSTLTVEMGGTGSYAASATHADVKHAIVQADARKLARTIRHDLFMPIIEFNMETLCKTFGATPDEIKSCVPTISWRIDREVNPVDRATIVGMAINEWGMALDEEQQRDEFGFDAPRPGSEALRGKATPITSGGAVVGALEASEGKENPKEETPSTQPSSNKESK